MAQYTSAQIAEILASHARWLRGDAGGSRANLSRADIYGADIYGADLSRANLSGANLSRANLSRAKLYGADLYGADLYCAKVDPKYLVRRQIAPESGAFEGYKRTAGGEIVHLRVPAEARRSGGAVGRKCRAEFVEVIAGSGVSIHDGKTKYEPGAVVRCHEWNPDPAVECGGGIHFFLTRLEAEEYGQ